MARFTSRTRARKRAVDTIFEADQRESGDEWGLRRTLTARRHVTAAQTPLPPYAIEIVEGVADHLHQIDDLLATHSSGRPWDRLPATDRAIMRAATWEIVWNDEVPAVTAIDEAVKIAREISTDDSPAIVNAILDAIRKDAPSALAAESALAAAFGDYGEPDYDDYESDYGDDAPSTLDDYDDTIDDGDEYDSADYPREREYTDTDPQREEYDNFDSNREEDLTTPER